MGLAFFTTQKLGREEIQKTLRWLVLPVIGIAFLILVSIEAADFIEFIPESNFATSGGYGPNQVSAILGLGALACWLLVLSLPTFNLDRLLLMAVSAGLLIQAVFTFSRGGVYNVLIAAPLATLWLIRGESRALRAAFMGVIVVGAIAYLFLPQLNTISSGALEARYQDLDTTGRDRYYPVRSEHLVRSFLPGCRPWHVQLFSRSFSRQIGCPAHRVFTLAG